MKRISINILLGTLLACISLSARSAAIETVDSLLQVFDGASQQQRLVVGKQLLDIYSADALFFDSAPKFDSRMDRDRQNLILWFGTVRYYTTNSYYTEALSFIDRALPLAEKLGDKDIQATLLCDKSYCLFKTSDYQQAISVGQEAKALCKQTKNWMQLSRAYLYLSIVNHALQNYAEAISLVEKSISTNKRLGTNIQTHNALGVACEIYCSARQLDKAIEYGQQAVDAAREIDYQPGVANHLTQLSYAYDRKGDYAKGIQMADEAIEIVKRNDPIDRNQLALSLEFKGWNLLDLGRNKEAVDALKEAIQLEEEVGNTHAVCYDYRTLYEALEPLDAREALKALKRYTVMSDSIHTQQLKELMSKANAEFHNEELEEANAEGKSHNRILLGSSLGIISVLSILILSLWWAYRQKQRTNKTLKRLTEAREAFFTNITHEFRTPLTVILGLGKNLQGEAANQPEKVQEMAHVIVRSGNGLLELINQLLDISKVQSAIGTPQWRHGNLLPYVKMLVENFQAMAVDKSVQIRFNSSATAIEMDFIPDYIRKIVRNLVSNSMKYTPPYGEINIACERKGNNLMLAVSDTGVGIKPEILPHIFDAFYQGEDDSQNTGTGVGLSLVKQIVDVMGGTIKVNSILGQGTTFTILLPIQQGKGQLDAFHLNDYLEDGSCAPDNAQEEDPDGENIGTRILIVEDSQDVAYYIGSQLEGKYQLFYAQNGADGLVKATDLMPDLIVTDLMMPEMGGLEMCRKVRESELLNHIPIIVITAKATEKDRIKGIESGANAYLYKPFNAEELNVRVETLIQQSNILRQKFSSVGAGERSDSQLDDASRRFLSKFTDIVFALIRENKLNNEQLTARMFMSRSQLNRKLLALTGQNTQTYVTHIRINYAKRLLQSSLDTPIGEVALKCGYDDVAYFSRVFKQLVGVTPTQYRRQPN